VSIPGFAEYAGKILAITGAFKALNLLGKATGISSLVVGLINLGRGFFSANAAAAASTGIMGTLGGKMRALSVQTMAAAVAEKAVAAARAIATAAQWALNAAMTANPIGLIIAGIALLVAGLVWFFTQTEIGQKIVQAAWNGIKTAAMAVVNWFTGTALPVLNAVWNGIKKGLEVAWVVIRVIFVTIATVWTLVWLGIKATWNAVGAPVFALVKRGAAAVWNFLRDKVFTPIKTGWQLMLLGMAVIKRTVLDPIWASVKDGARIVWNFLKNVVFNPIKAGWKLMLLGMQVIKRTVLDPIWASVKDGARIVWNFLRDAVFNPIKAAWRAVGDALRTVKNNVITPVWNGIKSAASAAWNWIRDKAFNPIKKGVSAVGSAFEKTKNFIKKVWDGIKAAAAKPVNFVIETVYTKGIKATWDKIAKSVGLDLKLPTVNPIKFANGSEDHRAQIARGGAMRLWAEPETGGEAYIPLSPAKRGRSTSILNAVAGKFGYRLEKYASGGITGFFGDAWDKIKKGVGNVANFISNPVKAMGELIKTPMNKILGSIGGGNIGKIAAELPRKAVGALINKAKDLASKLTPDLAGGGAPSGSGLGWKNQWNVIKNAFPGANLHSAYRPGAITAVGTPSMHGMGRAIDITPSMAIFNWIAKHFKNATELIFSPAGNRQLYKGRRTTFGEPTRGDHWDHIHWAMANGGILGKVPKFDSGGILGKGLNLVNNATGGLETLVRPDQLNLEDLARAIQGLSTVVARAFISVTAAGPSVSSSALASASRRTSAAEQVGADGLTPQTRAIVDAIIAAIAAGTPITINPPAEMDIFTLAKLVSRELEFRGM
jgi:hypothetical protein